MMVVKALRNVEAGEELTISYTPPIFNTSVRQMILSQTKVKLSRRDIFLNPNSAISSFSFNFLLTGRTF